MSSRDIVMQRSSGRAGPIMLLVLMAFVLIGCQGPPKVRRYGAVIGVKPEKLEYYKELHAHPWPSVNGAITEANIRDYSIYLRQFDDTILEEARLENVLAMFETVREYGVY